MSQNPRKPLTQEQRNKLMKDKLAVRRKGVHEQFLDKVTKLPANIRPGNVGDINNVIWASLFTTNRVEVAPNTTVQANFIVNAEASLVVMGFMKTVFLKTGVGPFTYVGIDDYDESAGGNIDGLYFQIRDAQSGRVFNQSPTPIEALGTGGEPTALETPFFLLPNSTVEFIFSNNNAANTYVPFISVLGYRARVQNQNQFMSTVNGKVGSGLDF